MSRIAIILGTSGLVAVGFLLNILACALQWPNATPGVSWYAMFAILFFLVSPIPVVLCGKGSGDPFGEDNSSWPDVAFFLTGVLSASGFALPAVLCGAGVIVWQTLVMCLSGGLVTGAAAVIMIRFVLGAGNSGSEMSSW